MTAARTRFRSTRESESRSKKTPGVRIAGHPERSILGNPGRFEHSARQSELRFLSETNSHGLILLATFSATLPLVTRMFLLGQMTDFGELGSATPLLG
jgi:hypothetical protein